MRWRLMWVKQLESVMIPTPQPLFGPRPSAAVKSEFGLLVKAHEVGYFMNFTKKFLIIVNLPIGPSTTYQ